MKPDVGIEVLISHLVATGLRSLAFILVDRLQD